MARGSRRGTRRGLTRSAPKIARTRGHGRQIALSRGVVGKFARSGTTTPYGKGTPSIKRRDVYDALRRKGYSKQKAAKIANATANGTNG